MPIEYYCVIQVYNCGTTVALIFLLKSLDAHDRTD